MKWLRPALFTAGLVLASLAESAGPFWFLAAGGSFISFTALLVLSVRGEAVARRRAGERREITIALPPPLCLEEIAGAADTSSCTVSSRPLTICLTIYHEAWAEGVKPGGQARLWAWAEGS
jgi:hypothetical protein